MEVSLLSVGCFCWLCLAHRIPHHPGAGAKNDDFFFFLGNYLLVSATSLLSYQLMKADC